MVFQAKTSFVKERIENRTEVAKFRQGGRRTLRWQVQVVQMR